MTTAVKRIFFVMAFVLLTACGESSASYETYHNQRYGYTVEYPVFLVAQGEATNQDGQKFISEDQAIELLVYRDYKNDYLSGGDLYSIEDAYQEHLSVSEGVFNKKLEDSSYIIEYKIDDILHTDYALLHGDNYFNIRFSYPEKDQERLQGTIEHVIKSLTLDPADLSAQGQEDGNAQAAGLADTFPAFLEGFLSDVYLRENFNHVLRSNDKTLATYIDPNMDVRRYYAPGTVAKLGSRAEDFGFTQGDDFSSQTKAGEAAVLEFITADVNPCDLDFYKNKIVYYKWLHELPELLVDMETFATKSVEVIYPAAEIMAVYIADSYGNPRGFYFINTPNGWKLAFVDDSLCQA